MEKKKIEERKTALQNQHEDVAQKINQGKNALGNLEATLMGLKGAISQIDWVLGLFVDEKKDLLSGVTKKPEGKSNDTRRYKKEKRNINKTTQCS